MKRDPEIGFLWIGAFILRSYRKTFQEGRQGFWSLDFNAGAWTGTLVSFMQEPVSMDCSGSEPKEIPSADEAQLIYLTNDPFHNYQPLFPWPPFGHTAITDLDLSSREHIGCPGRHGLQIQSITWDTVGPRVPITIPVVPRRSLNGNPRDSGVSVPLNEFEFNPNDGPSEGVTRQIFTWLRDPARFPLAEREIYKHTWLDGWDSGDDSPITGDALSSVGVNLHGWIAKTMTKRSNTL